MKGEKGERGERGAEGKASTIPGPAGKDGKDGKSGKDGKDSTVPGPTGPAGAPGRDGSPDTAEEVRDKLQSLHGEERLAHTAIKGLEERLDTLSKQVFSKSSKGGGMGNAVRQSFTGDGSTTSFTLTNNVSAQGAAILAHYNGQYLIPTDDFSVSGKTLTTTFTPVSGKTLAVWYIRT